MKPDVPSRTAQLVTMGRAMAQVGVSDVPGFQDPTARSFLSDKATASLDKIARQVQEGREGIKIRFARLLANTLALRTLAIDAAVRSAVSAGARQLVILGAGYDGRAWRMPELSGVKVFEVDHPATQGVKRARVQGLKQAAATVTFVPTNFEHDSLAEVLDRAGHDEPVPTCWIWEGVVMYLTRDAMRATLSGVAERSAAGSTLILNYHSQHRRLLSRVIFRLIGEPMISAHGPSEMAVELQSTGFQVIEDSGIEEWNTRWAGGRARVDRRAFVRVAGGRKR